MSPHRTKVERLKRQDPPKVTGLPERVALFIGAVHRGRSEALLEGLAEPAKRRATTFLERMAQWDSGLRQARLTHEFGVRPEAGKKLAQLVVKTDGELRAAIVAALPPAIRTQYPQFKAPAESFSLATRALAARLVREASR
jgi:hypothetical protein